jgi:hypothetical protein
MMGEQKKALDIFYTIDQKYSKGFYQTKTFIFLLQKEEDGKVIFF